MRDFLDVVNDLPRDVLAKIRSTKPSISLSLPSAPPEMKIAHCDLRSLDGAGQSGARHAGAGQEHVRRTVDPCHHAHAQRLSAAPSHVGHLAPQERHRWALCLVARGMGGRQTGGSLARADPGRSRCAAVRYRSRSGVYAKQVGARRLNATVAGPGACRFRQAPGGARVPLAIGTGKSATAMGAPAQRFPVR